MQRKGDYRQDANMTVRAFLKSSIKKNRNVKITEKYILNKVSVNKGRNEEERFM